MKTKFILLFLLLLGLGNTIQAQPWFRYKTFPPNIVPMDVTINNAGTLFLLAKDGRLFYKTINSQWTEIPGSLSGAAKSITVDKQSDQLYVGTESRGMFVTNDFGGSWRHFFLTTNPVSALHEDYYCFTSVEDPDLFFAGTIGGVIRITNHGTAGDIIAFGSPFTTSPLAVHYTRNHKLLAGTFNDGIWLSADNAATFSPTNLSGRQVYRFTEDLNGRVYALCKDLATQITNLVYSDNYMDWNTINVPDPAAEYTALYFDSATARLWLGSAAGLYQTAINTVTWEDANLNNGRHSVVEVISSRTGLYNFSRQHTAQQRRADATAWDPVLEGLTGNANSLMFNTSNKLFAYKEFFSEAVSSLAPPAVIPGVLGNWLQAIPDTTAQSIFFLRDDKQHPDVIFSYMSTNRLYRSDDQGLHFSRVSLPAEATASTSARLQLLVSGEQAGLFAVGTDGMNRRLDDKLFGSFDKGENWQLLSEFVNSNIRALTQDAGGRLFALVNIDTASQMNLYHSADTGRTWRLLMEDLAPVQQLKLYTRGNRTFMYSDRQLYRIDPAAATPGISVNLPWPPSSKEVRGFAAGSNGTLYLYHGDLYQSRDTGGSWQNLGHPAVTPGDLPAREVVIAFDSIPFIIPIKVTPGQEGIYYYSPLSLLGIQTPVKESSFTLYPNPVHTRLRIRTSYRGPVSVFNLLGQPILRTEIRKEETTITTATMSPGIYFIRLEGTGQSVRFIKK